MENNLPQTPEELTADELSPEQLAKEMRQSMAIHLQQKAQEIISKFGPIDYQVLQAVIEDRKYIRYPVTVMFDSSRIEPGLFAITEDKMSDAERQADEDDEYVKPVDRSYEMIIHEHFKDQPEKLLPLVLYQLPIVNYGDVVTFEDSEVFGSEMMGMPQDDYYELICALVDSIP